MCNFKINQALAENNRLPWFLKKDKIKEFKTKTVSLNLNRKDSACAGVFGNWKWKVCYILLYIVTYYYVFTIKVI